MSMIISRTPLRISFAGGGTDFPDYFLNQEHGGQVVSTTIDKYIYITITEKFDGRIHIRYAKTECADNVDDIQHNLFRECLKMVKIYKGVELTSISDVPGVGSGLGSSSALTVGILKALYAFKGYDIPPYELAKRAANIEIKQCGAKIGLQDQFASAYGDINQICFRNSNYNGDVHVYPLRSGVNYSKLKWLEEATMLFYLGSGHDSSEILSKHIARINEKEHALNSQFNLATAFIEWLESDLDNNFMAGDFIRKGWELKKSVTPEATNPFIDNAIESSLSAGAYGAKVCGAGDGGFLMVICDPSKQYAVREALMDIGLKELKFNFCPCGSQIIYNGRCGS